MAKEANKADYPISCVITNLPAFLISIEKINHPYRISFNYAAETIPEKQFINIGNIIFFGIIGYIFYKYKTGSFNFGTQGLDSMLKSKKF